MTQWDVITVLIALAGLIVTVTRPIVQLNSAITRLSALVDEAARRLDRVEKDNAESHHRLWHRAEEQEKCLNDHEHRLERLEKGENL